MPSLIGHLSPLPQDRPLLSAIDQLADRVRWRSLPWQTRHLARRHNLRPAAAAIVAEALGYTGAGR